MRNVLRVHEIRAGNINETPDIVVGFADGGAPGIYDGDAIHVEVVAVCARLDGAERHFPHPVGSLRHLGALTVARDVASAESHGVRLWRQNAERDVAVRGDFGRHNLRALGAAALRVCGRSERERCQQGSDEDENVHTLSIHG